MQEQLESIASSIGDLSWSNIHTEMCEEDRINIIEIGRQLTRIADSLQAIERTLHKNKDKNKDKNK